MARGETLSIAAVGCLVHADAASHKIKSMSAASHKLGEREITLTERPDLPDLICTSSQKFWDSGWPSQ